MRTKLSEKYKNEREELCNKIINILNLKEDNTILLCDLDEDIEKQNKLLNLKQEIQTYFSCFNVSAFKPNFECKRPYLSIIRSILRKQNYTIENKDFWIKYENGLLKRTIQYKIVRSC